MDCLSARNPQIFDEARVCVRERERDILCVSERKSVCEGVFVSISVIFRYLTRHLCVCVRERDIYYV